MCSIAYTMEVTIPKIVFNICSIIDRIEEPASIKTTKFEQTNNIIRNYGKTEKNIELPIPLINQRATTNQRPTVKVNLYIDHSYRHVCYISSKHYKILNKAGIKSSIQNQQKMPVVKICAITETEECDWNNHIPQIIQHYEKQEALTEKDFTKIYKKRFPDYLPADLLYQCKAGDIIYLTVHGYPVIATCKDNPLTLTMLPFKEHFNYHMNLFAEEANFSLGSIGKMDNTLEELQATGLIDNNHEHGPNRFISIEKLLLEDQQISNKFNYLKHRELGYKSKIFFPSNTLKSDIQKEILPQPDSLNSNQWTWICTIS